MASRSSASLDTDAEDVSDFLQRIKELGQKRDQEDEERNRKLEEEILQGRRDRQARREERARSISPTKSSPANTPPHNQRRSMFVVDSPRFHAKKESSGISSPIPSRADDVAEQASGGRSTSDTAPALSTSTDPDDTLETVTSQNRNSHPLPSAIDMPVTRELSWQQRRPKSQASDSPRSRPLSQVATENASAARTPVTRSPETPTISDDTQASRDQIAQSLGSKDPSFFKQTADRGIGSVAWRKNSEMGGEVVDHSIGAELPGTSRSAEAGHLSAGSREVSPNRANRSKTMPSSIPNMDRMTGSRSPMPMSPAQRLEPPGSDSTSTIDRKEYGSMGERTLAMSPAQGRISPEKPDRPLSPTKGLGGFVQSAMMKRSDSVNKRWSVQSPQGLSRSGSVVSNRSSYHPSTSPEKFGELLNSPPMREPTPLSQDHTSRPSSRPPSRPTSSYGGSNATVIHNPVGRAETPGPAKSSMTTSAASTDGFIRSALPASNAMAQSASSTGEDVSLNNEDLKTKDSELPTSPTKIADPRRWSPTKASWLETALNKPDPAPKPKAPAAPSQPSWMAEIAKARQKSVDLGASRNNVTPKHEVNIGGLMRSPAMGVTTKPLSLGGISKGFSTTIIPDSETTGKVSGGPVGQFDGRSSPRPTSSSSRPTSSSSSISTPGFRNSLRSSDMNKSPGQAVNDKQETSPKKDFRSSLKPRQPPPPNAGNDETEFKSVFGQLKRTKPQNYVAPDALKDNILRGKSALNATGGPKKTERVDEFKEAILQKKKAFEKVQIEGKGVARTSSSSSKEETVPEAIAKRRALAWEKEKAPPPSTPPRPVETGNTEGKAMETLAQSSTVPDEGEKLPASAPQKEIRAPGRLQVGGKLADRFNPALAGLLARGPPTASSDTSRGSSPSNQCSTSIGTSADAVIEKPGPKLEHVTKGRARGPRRKAPSSSKKSDDTEMLIEKRTPVDAAVTTVTKAFSPTQKPVAVDTSVGDDKVPLETASVKPEELAPGAVDTTSQPTSSHKRSNTINRRSRFLEELANKNEKLPEPITPKSPIKKLNLEGIFQAPPSPANEVVRSPVRRLNHEFLPKSPSKALDYGDDTRALGSPTRQTATSSIQSLVHDFPPKSPTKASNEVDVRGPSSPAKEATQSQVKPLNNAFLAKNPTKALNEDNVQGPSSPAKEATKSPVKPLNHVFLSKSPTKSLNVEGNTQVPPSPVREAAKEVTKSPVKPLYYAFLPKSPTKALNESDVQGPSSPAKEATKSPIKPLNHAFLPKSPTKSLNVEGNTQVPSSPATDATKGATKFPVVLHHASLPRSPTSGLDVEGSIRAPSSLGKQTTRSPVKPLNRALPKSPVKAEEFDERLDGTSDVKIDDISNSDSSTIAKEKPLARANSPPETQNIFEDGDKTGPASKPDISKPEMNSNPIDRRVELASHPVQENLQDLIESPASPALEEKLAARPKSPSLAMNVPVVTEDVSATQEPVVPKPEIASKPISVGLDSASHPVQEKSQNPIKSPASLRPIPKTPAPIIINKAETPLSPSAAPKEVERVSTPLSSASPSKNGFPSVSQGTEASKLFKEFFGEQISPPPDYKIDTSAILETKPAQTPKVSTSSCQLYQLAAGGKKTPVQLSQETTLFEGNLYICVHTFRPSMSFMKSTEVYLWIGDEAADSVVQDAAVFAAREAKAAGGKLIVLHQGRESSTFFHALGGIVITRRGESNKYDSLAPYILCGRQYLGFIAFDEVDLSPTSLSSGFPYIVNSQSAKVWLWKGKGSSAVELSHAKTVGADLAIMGPMQEVEEGSEPGEFLKIFGDDKVRIRGGAGHWKLKANCPGYRGRLFKTEESTITEISPFDQKSISPHHIYVLDAFFEIYIIIGALSGASSGASPLSQSSNGGSRGNQYQAFHTALQFSQEYAILSAGMEDRPFVPVSTVVVEGMPRDAKVVVRKWSDQVLTTRNPDNSSLSPPPNGTKGGLATRSSVSGLKRGRSLRVVPLMAALEATKS